MKGSLLEKRPFLLGRAVQSEKGDHPGLKRMIGKLRNVLEEGSKPDLEKKIGRPWHEWQRWD